MTEPGIHPTALPNDLPPDRLRHRPDERGDVAVDPATAGWRYLSFRAMRLADGDAIEIGSPDRETAVVNLFGGDLRVDVGDAADGAVAGRGPSGSGFESAVLAGRATVFDGLPSAFYLPSGRTASAIATGRGVAAATMLAIATAPTRPEISAGLSPVLIRPDDVRVEVRGAGHSTREIHHIVAPDFPADRLLLVEVLTPAGNWSSWPPHKHDTDDMPDEAVLEEVYHYRFRRREAWALQRIYRAEGSPLGAPRDAVWAVRDGDVTVVTDGYHPFSATDADDAYYLNALAGDRRTMACSFDPALDHVRSRWASEPVDPRLPMVGRAG
ncbi:MAG: 5-deoxy-glucuronate isomerase [Chloroflexota bacterium]